MSKEHNMVLWNRAMVYVQMSKWASRMASKDAIAMGSDINLYLNVFELIPMMNLNHAHQWGWTVSGSIPCFLYHLSYLYGGIYQL